MAEHTQREIMEYDVVIVGAGPAGLSSAIRLQQLARAQEKEITVCVLEKGSEVGAHILSGAVIDPRALDELFPDWQTQGAPLKTLVAADEFHFLTGPESSFTVPGFLVPAGMHNRGNYIVSLGNVCRWLATRAEALGVEIYPGFSASEILFAGDSRVKGVATNDMGIAADGRKKNSYEAGMELHATYTLFAEGCRGHLGKQLIEKFDLAAGVDPQHYGIGIKELWEVRPVNHQQGKVVHGAGWPLSKNKASGGGFLYHQEEHLVAVGLIVDLNYSNPTLSPYDEFQRFKHHPLIAGILTGGRRIAYGARAITKGGLNSLPKMTFPGGIIIGCDAGTLNFARIKGTHTAMKSGIVAAETIYKEIQAGAAAQPEPVDYQDNFKQSWVWEELYRARNFGPALHRFGLIGGAVFNYLDQTLFRGRLPVTLRDRRADHLTLKPATECKRIDYPGPDGVLSFDKPSSVYLSSTNHEEDQPCHLTLKDPETPVSINLATYDAPEQRYCPAGVYEIVELQNKPALQINAQNCVHCKTCDIKDPTQNIIWVAPEGGGGPNYPDM